MTHTISPTILHAETVANSLPAWLKLASQTQRDKLKAQMLASNRARGQVQKLLSPLKPIEAFAAPILQKALLDYCGFQLDVRKTTLRQTTRSGYPEVISTHRDRSLLEAALTNFGQAPTFDYGSGVFTDATCTAPLSLEPERFARLCRNLDIGQRYQDHLDAVLNPEVQLLRALEDSDCAALAAEVTQARMAGLISETLGTLLERALLERQDFEHEGQRIRATRLTLFDLPVSGALVIGADRDAGKEVPCVLYVPGDPQAPLQAFANAGALTRNLTERFWDKRYWQFFSRFIAKRHQPAFYAALQQVLFPDLPHRGKVEKPVLGRGESIPFFFRAFPAYGKRWQETLDQNGRLRLAESSVNGNWFQTRARAHLLHLRDDARFIAVPVGDLDYQASLDALDGWLELGMNVLGVAAFFIPAAGTLMLVLGGAQILHEVYAGAHAYGEGQTAEALMHVFAILENLASTAAIGAVTHVVPSFVMGMKPVRLPSGETRLWSTDLAPYKPLQPTKLPAGLQADALGQYNAHGLNYVHLQDGLYEVIQREGSDAWHLQHPSDSEAYAPVVEHHSDGAWRVEDEQVLSWDAASCLRRWGPVTDGLSDAQLHAAMRLNGLSEAQMRGFQVRGERLPALMVDSLDRLRVEDRLARFDEALRAGEALTDQDLALNPAWLLQLPEWPANLNVEVVEPGNTQVYGTAKGAEARTLRVEKTHFASGEYAEDITAMIETLGMGDWLGETTDGDQRIAALRSRVADHVQRTQRAALKANAERAAREPEARHLVLLRGEYPDLPDVVLEELLDHSTGRERDQLLALGRAPLAMAERAEGYQRDVRLNRAIEGLTCSPANLQDRDNLCLGLLETLPGWSGEVRLELQDKDIGPAPVATAGPEGAGQVKRIERHAASYRPLDENGEVLAGDLDLFGAILRALPDSERVALGIEIHDADRLRDAISTAALANREQAARLLQRRTLHPRSQGAHRHGRQTIGYEQVGEHFTYTQERRLAAVFPDYLALTAEQKESFQASLRREPGETPAALVARMEQEWRSLNGELNDWANGSHSYDLVEGGQRNAEFRDLARTALHLKEAWRNRLPGPRAATELKLANLPLGRLPAISASFPHIKTLELHGLNLTEIPDAFLKAFAHVETFRFSDPVFPVCPSGVRALTGLRTLDLALDHWAPDPEPLAPLRDLARLETLHLDSLIAEWDGQMLAPLTGLERLTAITLSIQKLRLDVADLQLLAQINGLESLAIWDSRLRLTPQTAHGFSRLTRLTELDLSDNPLEVAPNVAGLLRLEVLELAFCKLEEWPAGLTELLDDEAASLRTVNLSYNQIAEVPPLAGLRGIARLATPPGDEVLDIASPGIELHENPLSEQSRAHLQEANIEFQSILPPAQTPVNWREGAPEALQQALAATLDDPGWAPIYRAFKKVMATGDYRTRRALVCNKMWSIMEAAHGLDPQAGVAGHAQLRDMLVELARDALDTCQDRVLLMLDDMYYEVTAWRATALQAATGPAAARAAVEVTQKLFRLRRVDRYADLICAARQARYDAIKAGTPDLPPLDALDSLSDSDLVNIENDIPRDAWPQLLQARSAAGQEPTAIDDVEITLKLRVEVARQLALPADLGEPHYTVELGNETVGQVAQAISQDTTLDNLSLWAASKAYWRQFLESSRAEAFQALRGESLEAYDYLMTLEPGTPVSVVETPPGPLLIDALKVDFPDKPWPADSNGLAPKLNADEYSIAQGVVDRWYQAALRHFYQRQGREVLQQWSD